MISKKISISLFLILLSSVLLAGCGKKVEKVNFDIDSEVKKIVDVESYPEELLNKELQDELKENSTKEEIVFVDRDLLGYEFAENKLPVENMFTRGDYVNENGQADWLGELWTVDIFENSSTTEITDVRYLLSFDENNEEYAYRRIKDITSEFLKKYNNVLYESNIFEFKFEDTTTVPIEIIFGIENAIVHYTIYSEELENGLIKPYIQIFFVRRDVFHDMNILDVSFEIENLETDLRKHNIKFKTMKLSPTIGYVIYDPDSIGKNVTDKDSFISDGVFYKD